MSRLFMSALAVLAPALALLTSAEAAAQSTIKRPGARLRYSTELEPHLLLGPYSPPGAATGEGVGLGARATFELVSEGFIAKINDSVGLGVGFDFVRHDDVNTRGECTGRVTGPNGTRICVEVDGSSSSRNVVYIPVVMQWNFWLTRQWSVFGEPGVFAYIHGGDQLGLRPFALYLGGRYHFSDAVALTLRVGYPTFSVGASFFF